jgi:hypothetical protein
MTEGGNIRPEKIRKHFEDCRFFYYIECEVQIQIQVVLVSAYETMINIG